MTGLRVEQLTIGRKYRDKHGNVFELEMQAYDGHCARALGRVVAMLGGVTPKDARYNGSDEGSGPFLPFGPGPEDLPALLDALEAFRARDLPQECASACAAFDRVIAPLAARLRQA